MRRPDRGSHGPNSTTKNAAPAAWNTPARASVRTTTDSRSGFTQPELDAARHDVAVLAEHAVTERVAAGYKLRRGNHPARAGRACRAADLLWRLVVLLYAQRRELRGLIEQQHEAGRRLGQHAAVRGRRLQQVRVRLGVQRCETENQHGKSGKSPH